MSTQKWAVENTNIETGQTVRFMETPQEWTAQLFCETANRIFTEEGRLQKSRVVKL
jgi:hypothetical protein